VDRAVDRMTTQRRKYHRQRAGIAERCCHGHWARHLLTGGIGEAALQVGEDELRPLAGKQLGIGGLVARIAAKEPMLAQDP
jgi:hypothetical protein